MCEKCCGMCVWFVCLDVCIWEQFAVNNSACLHPNIAVYLEEGLN